MWEAFASELRAALKVDALESSHPIRQSVNRPSDVELLFDTISYSKGGSLLRMLFNSDIMANGNFQTGLKHYLTKYKYSNAQSVQLFDELAKSSGEEDLGSMLESWIGQVRFSFIFRGNALLYSYFFEFVCEFFLFSCFNSLFLFLYSYILIFLYFYILIFLYSYILLY